MTMKGLMYVHSSLYILWTTNSPAPEKERENMHEIDVDEG